MNELEKIRELTPEFQGMILSNINIIEQMLNETIAFDICNDPRDIYKRVEFFNYFENFNLQSKIDLVKIILKNNYPRILKKFPLFFTELGDVKKMRDTIAHNTIAYEANSKGENAKLLLSHPIIKKQRKLTRKNMIGLMKKVEKIREDTKSIWSLVGRENGLNY